MARFDSFLLRLGARGKERKGKERKNGIYPRLDLHLHRWRHKNMGLHWETEHLAFCMERELNCFYGFHYCCTYAFVGVYRQTEVEPPGEDVEALYIVF